MLSISSGAEMDGVCLGERVTLVVRVSQGGFEFGSCKIGLEPLHILSS